MKTQLYIPKKIKVGFNKREDTYTKRLAYVIYYDDKGVLRKEKSWESWRDHKIKPEEYANEPMEGFVINRNVGGARQSYGWNTRNEYVRVFDPRGFEFEISVANLLFILMESNSIKGKGLEGKFIYCWSGTELVLLPVDCQEYKQCTEYTVLQSKEIGVKDLIPGCTYRTKKQVDLIYMGRFNWYTYCQDWNSKVSHYSCKKMFVFYSNKKKEDVCYYDFQYKYHQSLPYIPLPGIQQLAIQVTNEPAENYAELMDSLISLPFISKPVSFASKESNVMPISADGEFTSRNFFVKEAENVFRHYLFSLKTDYTNGKQTIDKERLEISQESVYVFTSDPKKGLTYKQTYADQNYYHRKTILRSQVAMMKFVSLYIVLENGKKIKFDKT